MTQNTSPLIRLKDVSYIAESKTILSDIHATVNYGEFVAITGPNGGGKTTLLRIILKLIAPSRGTVEYFGTDGRIADRLYVGYLPQKNMIDSHFPITVEEVIESGLLPLKGMSKQDRAERIEAVLDEVQLSSRRLQTIGTLSGGQLQRALLGRAIVSQPSVLILDEPLSYIDKQFESRLYEILADYARHSTILLVSHEMSVIAGMATRHLIVDHTLHECTAHQHYIPSPSR